MKNLSTAEQKIQAIHDWVCNNLAYDYELLNNGGNVGDELDYAFKNKRAICGGFATLGNIMFRAAGIPSLYVSGLGSSVGVFDETHTGQGHAWNVVYYNGAIINIGEKEAPKINLGRSVLMTTMEYRHIGWGLVISQVKKVQYLTAIP